ncbi:PepSY domain-containing protein [Oleiagrimonas sp. C23AA]|uniref:PepSY domain-containing protein n=1 Tax=Oleiagrimonas sp. C23AA TaxID=2719047 RepID=UPI001420CD74|nr:PepSY domain-containing protein [Oleiagrimonas sp. C23AA]NII11102.1 PepSY domain-containing protein [Oleiagrimonas sp. C23AA]
MTHSFRGSTIVMVTLALGFTSFSGHAETGDSAEAAATVKAHIAPVTAIRTVQEKTHGRAFGMGMEVASSGSWYEVQVDVKGKPMLARINPATGAWLGMSKASGEDAEGMGILAGAKVNLIEAVTSAERAGHGRALEAGPSGHGEQAHYDVDIAQRGGAITHYSVDANTGAVSADASDESD